jgi:hypothetical protein
MSIVVESHTDAREKPTGGLISYITDKLDPWRTHRDSNHKDMWDEYYRIWRGIFDPADKKRKSERSNIMTPASMQAVDSTVAEIEEALFGKEQWFDLFEDVEAIKDREKAEQMVRSRDLMLEKAEAYGVPSAVAKSVLLGAIFGTGIGKINTTTRYVTYMNGQKDEVVCVELIPLEPYEFVPDPTTDSIDDMLGMAHETLMPLHKVKKMQKDGTYLKTSIGAFSGSTALAESRFSASQLPLTNAVLITEWHGLVPAKLLLPYIGEAKTADAVLEEEDDDTLVEAIVTIGNESTILGAKANPFTDDDRCFVAYQHDTVPGYFWGRGVVEKAYHPQKALDTTVRTRMDAQGIVAHPMIAGDVTRLPRGFNLGVWPGKFWPTTGSPGDVVTGFNLGQVNSTLFDNAGDMERMVQTATGAMDPGAAYNPGQAGGATNTAINASSFIKRSKRTMQNIERSFMRPLITKMYRRYAQFDATHFPNDLKFRTAGTLGIMAREFEQQQLTQMLSLVPNESKPFFVMMKAIFENTSSSSKAELNRAVDEWINPETTPEMQEEMKKQKELADRTAVAQVELLEAQAAKAKAEGMRALADAGKKHAEAEHMPDQLHDEDIKNAINLREVQAFEAQNELSRMMQHLKAVDLAIKAMVAKAQVKELEASASQIEKTPASA